MAKQEKVAAFMQSLGFIPVEGETRDRLFIHDNAGGILTLDQATFFYEVVEEAGLKGRIGSVEACITALSFEGIKLTSEQEGSLRAYQRQLEAQLEQKGQNNDSTR